MSSKHHPDSLRRAIARVAARIPLDLMMTAASQEARLLAHRYRGARVNEMEILSDLVSAIESRKAAEIEECRHKVSLPSSPHAQPHGTLPLSKAGLSLGTSDRGQPS
jgi:hypothetical protein